jgi:hypothetical protein
METIDFERMLELTGRKPVSPRKPKFLTHYPESFNSVKKQSYNYGKRKPERKPRVKPRLV